nr:immunoglobulin light chain junction region [Macaca mulatta]
CMQGLEIPWTF